METLDVNEVEYGKSFSDNFLIFYVYCWIIFNLWGDPTEHFNICPLKFPWEILLWKSGKDTEDDPNMQPLLW